MYIRSERQLKPAGWLLVGGYLIFGLLFLMLLGMTNNAMAQEKSGEPRIEVPNDYFYFGYMPRDAFVSHTYWIKNVGSDTLEIINVKPGCGCTAVPLKQDKVAPGDSVDLQMTFDSKLMTGKVVKNIDIFTNDPTQEITTVKFFAVVNARYDHVQINPATLRFAKFGSEDGRLVKELTIFNHFDDDIEVSLIEFPEEFFTIDQRSVEVGGREKAVLTLEQIKIPTEKADYLTSFTFEFEGPETERYTVPLVCYFERGK